MYVVFLFRKRWLSVFIITWAVLNCYTRIYLGVHYPGDLIVGGIIGGFGGWLFCTIAHKNIGHYVCRLPDSTRHHYLLYNQKLVETKNNPKYIKKSLTTGKSCQAFLYEGVTR